ncbi:hypothetical protein ACE6ED_15610 [Paenibacillus sp. CN-4]|uniref:hypothetical protein n=1 Tax=Paenibacillus nanchangensis TaxID=3348343 RepID=UPI00397E368F
MNRRGTGISLILISALLYIGRYISAAIYGANATNYNESFFLILLDVTGSGLKQWSILSLVIGIIYLVLAEVEPLIKKSKEK